jgi:hypothetical protein
MFRVTRTAVAACLALAVAALPMMLDRCSELCDAHSATAASTPACHHAVAAGPHITKAPAPCGHDHSGTAVAAAKSFASTGRAFAFTATPFSQASITAPVGAGVRADPHAAPASSPPLAGGSLPLRV